MSSHVPSRAPRPAVIASVEPGSMACAAGIEPGDALVAINGHPIRDIIDYRYHAASAAAALEIEKPGGTRVIVELANGFDPRLGIEFDDALFDRQKRCANRCVFCFIDQLPRGMRKTLYVKDDDYRLSFLQGNFVTLTNLSEGELHRIIRLRLSPIYVSVHSTDDSIRAMLLGRLAPRPIMVTLRRLAAARIEFHTQVVMAPGMNDGEVLERTISDLWGLSPYCASVGVVPVGLTSHRQGLPKLTPVTPNVALATVRQIEAAQRRFTAERGIRFVFAADEFYCMASQPIPPGSAYEGYPQLENGIGLSRLFIDEFAAIEPELPRSVSRPISATVVTGASGAQVIGHAIDRLNRIGGVSIRIATIVNEFMGPSITVTGLVVGKDIISTLSGREEQIGDFVVIPEVMLRREGDRLLDNTTPDDISTALGVPVRVAPVTARGLVEAAIGAGCAAPDSCEVR
ncbi:MAG: DUF512 domain-containing protein [Clostridia bacterium]|nr:DUF512 domain-containing protein [Clostridia bacterium]